jgi:hypothetical protein
VKLVNGISKAFEVMKYFRISSWAIILTLAGYGTARNSHTSNSISSLSDCRNSVVFAGGLFQFAIQGSKSQSEFNCVGRDSSRESVGFFCSFSSVKTISLHSLCTKESPKYPTQTLQTKSSATDASQTDSTKNQVCGPLQPTSLKISVDHLLRAVFEIQRTLEQNGTLN